MNNRLADMACTPRLPCMAWVSPTAVEHPTIAGFPAIFMYLQGSLYLNTASPSCYSVEVVRSDGYLSKASRPSSVDQVVLLQNSYACSATLGVDSLYQLIASCQYICRFNSAIRQTHNPIKAVVQKMAMTTPRYSMRQASGPPIHATKANSITNKGYIFVNQPCAMRVRPDANPSCLRAARPKTRKLKAESQGRP